MPSPSSRASADVTSPSPSASIAASAAGVTGPRYSMCPRTAASTASSRSGGAPSRCAGSRTRGVIVAPGYSASIEAQVLRREPHVAGRRAHRRGAAAVDQRLEPSRVRTRLQLQPAPAATTRLSSRSCSSSASRGSGRASSRTRSIASASSCAEVALVLRQRAPQRDRARAALLERRVVEVGVRLRVQDLVRERRRLGRVARVQADLAALDALEHAVSRSMSIAS